MIPKSELDSLFFSIVIPTYNAEKTLEKCLKSIIIQNFKMSEIIIIDNLSTDSTYDLVESLKKSFLNLRFISESDLGIYDAMNKGVTYSSGKWIYFMGADDYFFNENVLQLVYQKIANLKTRFIYGNVIFHHSGIVYGERFNLSKLIQEKNICHQGIFYEKSIFSQIGQYNTNCKVYADRDFNIRCFLNSKYTKPVYINAIIAIYNELDGFSAKNEDSYFRILQNRYLIQLKKSIKYRITDTLKKIFFRIHAVYNNL
jgi:glycosyltransferase involved in cell wall biosynthesis